MKQAYEAGVRRAMIDSGLLKESAVDVALLKESAGTMDPVVQKGIHERRTLSLHDKNPRAVGYKPNVPMNKTETTLAANVAKPAAPAATGGYSAAVGASGAGYKADANKKFTGVGGPPGLPPLGHNRG